MSKKLLVIFDDNWADEMDIAGFDIFTKEHWEYKKLELEHTKFPQEVGFGTNESNTYDSAEEFLSMFKEQEISKEEEKIIRKFFGNYFFGIFPEIEGCAIDSFYEEHGNCPD